MKCKKTHIIYLLAICIVCMMGVIRPLDEKGVVDLGSIYNINTMVNL
jgi:hypothetical protein